MLLSEAEDNRRYWREWPASKPPRAVGDPVHVKKFFVRNLGGLNTVPIMRDRSYKGKATGAI